MFLVKLTCLAGFYLQHSRRIKTSSFAKQCLKKIYRLRPKGPVTNQMHRIK